MKKKRSNDSFVELSQLFFEMKQVIRANLPQAHSDPNAWMRFETLQFIEERKDPTMRDIAKRLRITAPSATSLVRNLASRGWIARESSVADGRSVRVALTAAGKREVRAYRLRARSTMRKVFSKMPRRDLEQLARVLRTLRDIHSA